MAARIAKRLSRALGPNGQALLEIIPELEPLVDPQPLVPALGPTKSQTRLTLAFQSALRIFATAEHPLVLFLDDLQWTDPASLKLLQLLLTDPERGYLLILGAYRDNEMDRSHPLTLALGELASQSGAVAEVTLGPLSRERGVVRRRRARLRRGARGRARSAPFRPDAGQPVLHRAALGVALITDAGERVDLARQPRRWPAGPAHDGVRGGRSALHGWHLAPAPGELSDHYELAFALHLARAECVYLTGEAERAEALFADLLARARSIIERADIYILRVTLYMAAGNPALAVSTGLDGLAMFGITLSEDEQARQAALAEQAAIVEANLAGRRIDELIDVPVMTDPELKARLRLLMSICGPSYTYSPTISVFIIAEMVNSCLKHGHAENSAFAYCVHGFLLASVYGRYQQGYAFGKLALALIEKVPSADLRCKVYMMIAASLCFVRPLRVTIELLRRAYDAGLAAGDFPYVSYTAMMLPYSRLGVGDELTSVLEETERLLALMQRTKEAVGEAYARISRQTAVCLLWRTKSRRSLRDDTFDPERFLADMEAAGFKMATFYYHCAKGQILFLDEDHEGALEAPDGG